MSRSVRSPSGLEFLRIECDRCGRKGSYSTAKLVATYGANASIEPLQNYVTRDCPKRRDPTIELGKGCAPLCPDLKGLWVKNGGDGAWRLVAPTRRPPQ